MIFPQPPWCFSNARVLYQPTFVPVEYARAVTPTGNDDKGGGLTMLSLFGWTLGGLFVVDWTQSPIGPYREVAVLSGLVARDLSIGAWASHIVVTSADAVESGRDLFGLPTVLGSIDFEGEICDYADYSETSIYDMGTWFMDTLGDIAVALKYASGSAIPGISEPAEVLNKRVSTSPKSSAQEGFIWKGDNDIRVDGWSSWLQLFDANKMNELDTEKNIDKSGGISLPSFSGRLNLGDKKKNTPLLSYPLRIVSARSLRLRPAINTKFASDAIISEELRAVLDGPRAFPCIQIDGVTIVAGKPTQIVS
mmetsp:Transcript_1175/g.2360  ORF Transcript_1175/g.2360 Transcript_1175/m.2360 type:complete len:308 (-) Transcript_1175:101-1024(-)